jgi:hypothetical protein
MVFALEDESKKEAFPSHGDFQRYLYEALVMSMPVVCALNDKGIIEAFLPFQS